jgi:hypothetical protein
MPLKGSPPAPNPRGGMPRPAPLRQDLDPAAPCPAAFVIGPDTTIVTRRCRVRCDSHEWSTHAVEPAYHR